MNKPFTDEDYIINEYTMCLSAIKTQDPPKIFCISQLISIYIY